MSTFLSYWRLTVPAKSVAEIEAERWLLLAPKRHDHFFILRWILFNRWYLVIVAFLNLFCIGSTFSFDFLDDAISGFFLGKAANQALSAQLLGMLTMALSAAVSGPFVERRGPRTSMAVGTVLVVLGWILAHVSVLVQAYPLLNFGMGVLVGLGYGIALVASVSTVQKWFPDLRGVVTGICVAGMGVGTMVWIKVYGALFHRRNENIFAQVDDKLENDGLHIVFFVHGVVALVVMLLATMVLRTPPPNYAVNGSDIHCVPLNRAPTPAHVQDNYLNVGMTLVNYAAVQNDSSTTDDVYFSHVKALSLAQCVFSSDFFFLYVAFAASVAPSVLFTFEMSEFVTEMLGGTDDQASNLLLYIGIASSLGNLLGPVLSDAIIRVFYANPAYVRKMVFTALLLSQCIGNVVLINNVGNAKTFRWPLYITTFSSGGGFGLIPSFLADLFGLYNAGTMYGLILTTWCIGSLVMGFKQREMSNMAHHISNQLQVLLIIAAVGCVVMVLVRSSSMDRFYRGYQLTVCGKVFIQRPSRHLIMEQNNMKTSEHVRTDVLREWGGRKDDQVDKRRMSESISPPAILVDPAYLDIFKR
ncbi:hypothetical protein AC1031_010244 [Aphanomyces cochlioides]|nr:hypothetical protein AC1031_010244 [Aphanomyces cochlioides]